MRFEPAILKLVTYVKLYKLNLINVDQKQNMIYKNSFIKNHSLSGRKNKIINSTNWASNPQPTRLHLANPLELYTYLPYKRTEILFLMPLHYCSLL